MTSTPFSRDLGRHRWLSWRPARRGPSVNGAGYEEAGGVPHPPAGPVQRGASRLRAPIKIGPTGWALPARWAGFVRCSKSASFHCAVFRSLPSVPRFTQDDLVESYIKIAIWRPANPCSPSRTAAWFDERRLCDKSPSCLDPDHSAHPGRFHRHCWRELQQAGASSAMEFTSTCWVTCIGLSSGVTHYKTFHVTKEACCSGSALSCPPDATPNYSWGELATVCAPNEGGGRELDKD
jgi:hypothetical protein